MVTGSQLQCRLHRPQFLLEIDVATDDVVQLQLISASSYPIKLNAVFLNGTDYIKPDMSGAFLRLDVKSLLKDESGAYITLYYTGQVETSEAIMKALTGAADAKTVEFGNVCECHIFLIFSNGDHYL